MTVRASSRSTSRATSRSAARSAARSTVRPGAALVLAAVLLAGCRIDVGTDLAFDRRGGGEVAVSVRVDGATLRVLDDAGVDPELDVTLALGPGSAWRTSRTVDADGGLILTYRQPFVDGAGATDLLRELSAGVAPQDPALRLDVTVVTSSSGAVRMAGTGAVSPPATLGVSFDDVPVGPRDEELAALVADAVRAQLVVRVPGRIVQHDADAVDGSTLRWALPVGEPRTIVLVADAPPLWRRIPWWWVGGAALVAAGVWSIGRRLRRRAGPGGPTGVPSGGPSGGGAEVSPAG